MIRFSVSRSYHPRLSSQEKARQLDLSHDYTLGGRNRPGRNVATPKKPWMVSEL